MATYYVSSAGNDGNNGTSTGTPFLTIGHAQSVALAADTINLRGGDSFTEQVSFTVGVTVQSYGTGQATILCGTGTALTFTSCDGITISNLILTGSSATYPGTNTQIILITSTGTTRYSGGVTVTGCTISNGIWGMWVRHLTDDTGGWDGVTITNNTIHDCGGYGIYVLGIGGTSTNRNFSNVTISGNTFFNMLGNPTTSGIGRGVGLALNMANTSSGPCTISNNLIYNTGQDNNVAVTGGGGGMFCFQCDGVVMKNNVAHDCHKIGGNDGTAFDIDHHCTNCISEYNVSYNCGGAGQSTFSDTGSNGNIIRFNLSINDATVTGANATGSLEFGASTDGGGGYTIHNNTFISLAGNPCVYSGATAFFANKKIYDNILYCASGPCVVFPTNQAGTDYDGNYYLSGTGFSATYNGVNYTSLAAWKTATGKESHGQADTASPFLGPLTPIPPFVPGSIAKLGFPYSLKAGTLPQASALDLQSTYSINPGTQDLDGNAIPVPYSVGAINPVFVPPGGSGAVLMFL